MKLRHDNDNLLLLLALALEREHKARIGHHYVTNELPLVACETCSYLRTVFDELEERNADAMMRDLDGDSA